MARVMTASMRRAGQPRGSLKDWMKVLVLRFRRTWKLGLALSIVVTIVASAIQWTGWFGIGGAELDAYDTGLTKLTAWTTTPSKSDDVVILAIDDLSIQKVAENESYALNFGSWPYSRNVWARVLEHLDNQGARAVVFDAVIDEPHTDPSGDIAMAAVVEQVGVPFYLGFNVSQTASALPNVDAVNPLRPARPAGSAPGDATPAAAADGEETFPEEEETFPEDGESFPEEGESFPEDGESFPEDGESFPEDGESFPEEGETADSGTLESVARVLAFPVTGAELPNLNDAEGNPRYPLAPIEPLREPTAGFGLVLMEQDVDGKLRRTRFAYTDGVNNYATLSVAVVADLVGATSMTLEPGTLQLGTHTVRVNRTGDAEINYGGRLHDRFETVSLIHVLDDWALARGDQALRLPDGLFKDKVVVIAGFALGTADVKPTPFSSAAPGVVKHAAEIDNLLNDRFIIKAPFWVSVLLTLLVSFLSVSIILVFQSLLLEIGWPVVLLYGFFVITGYLLVHHQVHVLSAMPSLAASFGSVLGALYNHFLSDRRRARLREAFDGSVLHTLLAQLVESPEIPDLGGEYREISIVITDIKGFTATTARYEDNPEALVKLMNGYFSRVTAVLQEYGGYIERYDSDTIVCLFGAPLREPDHAVHAIRACIAVLEAVEDYAATLPNAEDRKSVHTRIGLHSGKAFVGNFGSDQYVHYSAIGNGMRLAGDIERLNDANRTKLLIGARTAELAKDVFPIREVSRIPQGATEPEPVFEVAVEATKIKGKKKKEKAA